MDRCLFLLSFIVCLFQSLFREIPSYLDATQIILVYFSLSV